MTEVPGIKAQHAIITDECRAGRGEEGAIDEALARIRAEYLLCVPPWRGTRGVNFHVVLTVDSLRSRG